jgi:hypothetical protein
MRSTLEDNENTYKKWRVDFSFLQIYQTCRLQGITSPDVRVVDCCSELGTVRVSLRLTC